jgi:hypothetical protein
MQPVPCSQSLAGCPPSPAEAPLSDPAGAPTYNSGEGMTYMPSTQSGVSDQDQSPDLPQSFLDGEARSKRRMKKLAKLLKKSSKEQDALDVRVKELSEYVKGEVTAIRNDVMEINAKDTDEIAAPYHLVQGARGKIGVPGMDGLAGANGFDGPPGPQGPTGIQGPPGPAGGQGAEGARGVNGQRGPRGRIGDGGTKGPTGSTGIDGNAPDAGSWKPNRYFCPGAGNDYTRLVDCTTSSCRLETQYNGVWGTVCSIGFTSTSAAVACKGLGFPEGGIARRRGGGKGDIWLSRVRCKGSETDIGDCPVTCGGPGCNHAYDVGLCCNGFNVGPWGSRKKKRSSYTTLHTLRNACYTPDTCVPASDGKMVTLAAGANFDKRYWVTKLSVGDYAYISRSGKGVDNDKEMCVEKTCNMRPRQLSSIDVPQGYQVTLYSRDYFRGSSITYIGPVTVNNLYWEGWNDRTYSLKIASAKKQKRSEWKMVIAKSQFGLRNLVTKTLNPLDWVGTAIIPFVNLHGSSAFRKYVAGTPSSRFEATFWGNLKVTTPGKYKFCLTSDDGSKLWLNEKELINNDGLHGAKQRCADKNLGAGVVRVSAAVFNNGGHVMITLLYSGPDTGGNMMFVRSEDGMKGLPSYVTAHEKSNWALRVYKSSRTLSRVPDTFMLTRVGSKTGIREVKMSTLSHLRKWVPSTPSSNYAWVFYGVVHIETAGKYTWCSTSDDGSRLLLDGDMIVNNDGLHGARRICGTRTVTRGDHKVQIEGFQRGGGVYQTATYYGPDTGHSRMYIHSTGKGAGELPPKPPPSEFLMRMYYDPSRHLRYTKDLAFLDYKGKAKVPYIQYANLNDFRQDIKATPSSNYEWAIYGNLKVKRAGKYKFCTTSDDGSFLYVDGTMVVNNDGLHGARQRCGHINLDASTHKLFIPGFQHYGGAYMRAMYQGPDTGGVLRYLRSDSAVAPKKVPASKWLMRMFKTPSWGLRSMSDSNWRFLNYVGEGTLREVYLPSDRSFRNVIPKTPGSNYAWVIYGKVKITSGGKYQFCTTSDDGSFLFVDNKRIVNNDGLHGARRRCGYVNLGGGTHEVRVEGFQHHGGAYQRAMYRGPDTINRLVAIPSYMSKKDIDDLPPIPPPSQWMLRVYKTNYHPFEMVPDVSQMTYVGEAKVEYIYFRSLGDLRRYVRNTPGSKYAWQVYGKVQVDVSGKYEFCSRSDDGSLLYVGKTKVVDNDRLHGAINKCGKIQLNKGQHDVTLIGFQNYGGIYQDMTYRGPDTHNVWRRPKSVSAAAPASKKGKKGQYGTWPPEIPYGPGPGSWPKGYCTLPDKSCKDLGITDNLCGKCTKLAGGGFKLYSRHGLRFNGASFDDNQNGVGSYQAQNICMLAKYGNKGKITKYASEKSYGRTGGGVASQVHWFGNCGKNYSPYKRCCSNAAPLDSGFDWNKFSKGNSCRGDGDRDRILSEVNCWWNPPGMKPGPWPNGNCVPKSDSSCVNLGVKENLCGTCTKLSGGFRLESKDGLRFGGKSFDDNMIGKGSMQARNICALAKYGNKGTVGKFPNKNTAGYTNYRVHGQVHWFGNCREGGCSTCTGARPFKTGQDWTKFASGNSCRSDNDKDYVTYKVDCYF